MLKLLVRANARYDKAPLLLEVREEVEQLKVVLRLSQDVKEERLRRFLTKVIVRGERRSAWDRFRQRLDLTPGGIARTDKLGAQEKQDAG